MSILTQFYGGGGGGGGIGTVYTYDGNFTWNQISGFDGGTLEHTHNLNITSGYSMATWFGTFTDNAGFNSNGGAPGVSNIQGTSQVRYSGLFTMNATWGANTAEMVLGSPGLGYSQTPSGSLQIIY